MRQAAGLILGGVTVVVSVVLLANRVPDATFDVPARSEVVISEVVASNGSGLADDDGDFSDWVELHNRGGDRVDLTGHHLSDDAEQLQRWTFPSLTLDPDDRVVVWASGKDRTDADAPLHTDFSLAQGGEPIVLSTPGGVSVLDRIEPVAIPRNASFGRASDDPTRHCFFERPAPGDPDLGHCHPEASIDPPQLSVPGGFHDDAVDLVLQSPSGLDVYYTLDGSYPDPVDNPHATEVFDDTVRIDDRSGEPDRFSVITAAVPDPPHSARIAGWDGPQEPSQKATVVRARTPFSDEVSTTYLIGPELVRDDLPIVSLATDPDHLFDHDDGIHVPGRIYEDWRDSERYDPEARWQDVPANFHERGRAWERPTPDDAERAGVFTYCEPDEGCVYSNRVGLRIHGGVTRVYPFKSLRLYARNAYGDRTFEHPLFGEEGPTSHRRLLLRNSGNDWNATMLLDGYVQSLAGHLDVETQHHRPAVVFLNGEYWGLMNLRERYDRHHLANVHGVDPDEVVILSKDGSDWEVASGGSGAEEPYLDLLEFAETNDLADPDAFAHIEQRLDLDDLLDYLMIEVFAGNGDWPGNNTDAWRVDVDPDPSVDGPADGRWRWLTYDLDQLGGDAMDPRDRTLLRVTEPSEREPINTFGLPLLVTNLLENDAFEQRYLSHFADHLNTTFEPGRATAALDDLASTLEVEMERHVARWPVPVSMSHWRDDVALLRTYMQVRPDEQRQQLVDRFGLAGTTDVRVRTTRGGTVHVNDLTIADGTPGVEDASDWTGTYFQGVPVALVADPDDGQRFVRWEGPVGDPHAPTTHLDLRGPVTATVRAVFERD